jgi:hypothetical protein
MRTLKISPPSPRAAALLLAARVAALAALAALSAMACDRGTGPASGGGSRSAGVAPAGLPAAPAAAPAPAPGAITAGAVQAPAPRAVGQPQTNELQPLPQSVKVSEAAPPAPSRAESELAARERRLAERQAALDARERRLRHRERSPAPAAGAAVAGAGAAAGTPAVGAADAAAGAQAPPTGSGEGGTADGAPGMPGQAPAPAAEPESPGPAVPVTLPAGTRFEVEFTQGLASNTSAVGDVFRARLVSDLRLEGAVAIPAGAEILGVVTDAVGAGRIGGQAKLTVRFTDLVLPSGSTLPVHASFLEQGKSRAGRDAATIGGTTAGGALLGRILSSGSRTRGTVLGAIIGAAVGTAIAAKTAGEEVVIPEGSVVSLKLDGPLEIRAQPK